MSAVTPDLQSRLKSLLQLPSEEKAFWLLRFIEHNQSHIQRGGLENKAVVAIPHEMQSDDIQHACMVIRDVMVSNQCYDHACDDLEVIERALHKEAKRRRKEEAAKKGPLPNM